MSTSPFAHASQTIEEERIQTRLNWVPLALVKTEDRDERCLKCRGRYEDPLADADRSTPPNQSDLEVSAGDSDITDDTLYFSDDVTVSQGYRILKAQEVIIDRVEQTVSAEGPIEVREPGIVMYGDRITYDSLSERAWLSDTEFVMYEQQLYGIAERVTRDANGSLEIEDGQLTFCAPTDPSWLVTAETLRVDPTTNTGEAWGARIDIKGVPVAYLPWVQFPLNDRRKTGLLFPDISSDTRGGLDITAPIYLNLAPNYDATYSPRLIQDRGLVHQLNTRFLGKRTGFWDISGTYLRDDDLDASDSDNNRWLVNVQQSSDPSARLRTSINFTKVSDNEYLRDLENNTLSAQRQTALLQRARVDWLADSWLFGLEAQQFQSIGLLRRSRMALTNKFSYENALECANLSNLAYQEEKAFKKAASAMGYKNVKYFNVDGAQAYGMAKEDYIVLAFRGTEPTQFNDIKADLNALHVRNELGKGRVHKGFKKEVDDIKQKCDCLNK